MVFSAEPAQRFASSKSEFFIEKLKVGVCVYYRIKSARRIEE
jgi:hypothetical protein